MDRPGADIYHSQKTHFYSFYRMLLTAAVLGGTGLREKAGRGLEGQRLFALRASVDDCTEAHEI